MNSQRDCIFCQIVSGQLASYKIWENEHYLAFLDVFPSVKAHTLIIPKTHYYSNLLDIEARVSADLLRVGRLVGRHIRQTYDDLDWISFSMQGTEIAHLHLHLRPMWGVSFGVARKAPLPPELKQIAAQPAELAATAKEIRQVIKAENSNLNIAGLESSSPHKA